jgi:hypothetical protein
VVFPVALGGGMPLFAKPINLALRDTKPFGTGTVVLTYVPA